MDLFRPFLELRWTTSRLTAGAVLMAADGCASCCRRATGHETIHMTVDNSRGRFARALD